MFCRYRGDAFLVCKIIVTGAKGQLGTELVKMIKSGQSELGQLNDFYRDVQVIAADLGDLDICDAQSVYEFVEDARPYAVVNCAAMTDVDGCETNSAQAFKINALGPRNLAVACENVGAKLVQISTDYVFDGCKKSPYVETDSVAPRSVYGASKNLGEQYVKNFSNKWFILRTAWLYGYEGNNFVKTIVKAGREKGFLKVVNDQIGNPTNAVDLAWHICKLLKTNEYGIYHCTGKGECSWFDFACEIVKNFGIDAVVRPCSTDEFPRPASRPQYSSLKNFMLELTVGDQFRPWQEALKSYSENIQI